MTEFIQYILLPGVFVFSLFELIRRSPRWTSAAGWIGLMLSLYLILRDVIKP